MFAHVPLALLVQCAAVALGRALAVPLPAAAWLGAFAAVAVCIAREVTQHEYRWIEHKGGGRRANMPWYAGFRVWRWNGHSIAETLVAILVVLLAAAVAALRG